ncbi:MAG: undecaprenyl-phosphate glucose phosphotransferase [Bacteroidota bacterium]
MKEHKHAFRLFVILTDVILTDLCLKAAHMLKFGSDTVVEDYYFSFFYVFIVSWIAAGLLANVYSATHLFDFRRFLQNLFYVLCFHIIVMGIYIFNLKGYLFSRLHILYAYSILLSCVILFRFLLSAAFQYYKGISYYIRKIVIVGGGKSAEALFGYFSKQDTSVFRFMEDVHSGIGEEAYEQEVSSRLQELQAFCLSEQINEIYFSLPLTSTELIDEITRFTDDHFIHFRIVSNIKLLDKVPARVDLFGQIPIITLRKEPLRILLNRAVKRTFDVAFSLLIIMTLFPTLVPIIILLIKLDSRGPIIFTQQRSGRKNKAFSVYKFRTMYVEAEGKENQATKNDQRVTRVGKWLRRTSMDELPQFMNVLLGQMSVVGPRPHMLRHTEEYSKIIHKYLFRHFITPGITGYAQVNGLRGETTNDGLMKKRIEYDTWYIENWSLFLDIKIIIKTIWNILSGERNAY